MVLRGSRRRFAVGTLCLVAATVPLWVSGATAAPPASNNAKTLQVSLPGPFNGCTYLDAGANATGNAVLDLVRPSAFLTNPYGNLVGEGGPIASAELVSLSPEVVRYTIAPHQKWSDGTSFTGADLVAWWLMARDLASLQSDGYRTVKSLVESIDGLTVTATFATPYAEWNLLFRDVEATDASTGCSLVAFVHRPSLGPYLVQSATRTRIVLVIDHRWSVAANRFGRVVLSDDAVIPASTSAKFVGYSLDVNRSQILALSSHSAVLSRVGTSSDIEEIAFSPSRPFSSRLAVREALSWSLDRLSIIDQLFGAVTFSTSIAASAMYSQGQNSYPGPNGTGPTSQTTTSTVKSTPVTSRLDDCLACAVAVLAKNGFFRTTTGWATAGGIALAIRLAVGPSALDHATADRVGLQWRRFGVAVTQVRSASDMAAAVASATGRVDAAIFARPTITTASYAARSWSGPGYADTYPSGWRSSAINALFRQAIANFNPVAASSTWLAIDRAVLNAFWVRPLFTSPSLLEWSNKMTGVNGSNSLPGLLDQLPLWATTPPVTGS